MTFYIKEAELIVDPVSAIFPGGIALEILPLSYMNEDAIVHYGDRRYTLPSVVDTTQTIDHARVFVIISDIVPREAFLLGGHIAYHLYLDKGEQSFKINKEVDLSEFSYWNLIETDLGLLCIHEIGVFLIDVKLNILWYRKKSLLDHFDKVDSGKAWFLYDHEENWRWGLTLTEGIADPHPVEK